MKKKVLLSIYSLRRRKNAKDTWDPIITDVPNLHSIRQALMGHIEHQAFSWGGVPLDSVKPLEFKLAIDGEEWNLPSFELVSLYDMKFIDATSDLFREIERVLDLHEAFYDD